MDPVDALPRFLPNFGATKRVALAGTDARLYQAYLNADRLEEARQLLVTRRPGASGIPVAGAAR